MTTKTIYPGSTTDRSAQLRAALKAKGWTSRDVSVRSEYYSMGSSIHVVIKNPAVPLKPVEDAANQHESIDRDQFGEILSGGNRFVHVSYTSEALAVLAAPFLEACKAAGASIDASQSDTSLFPVGETGYLMGRDHYSGYSLWRGGFIQSAMTAEYLAQTIAIHAQGAVTSL